MERQPLYNGKAKQVFPGPEAGQYVVYFKDSATAFNAKKKAEIEGKGSLNQRISANLFRYLEEHGVRTHFIRSLSDREMLVRAVTIVPIEVVVRNLAAGSLCRRLGVPEKLKISPPLVEFYLKNDALDDPLLTDEHVRVMKLATPAEAAEIKRMALRVNELLSSYFERLGIVLADFKLEFGRTPDGELLLADEISPDGCRLWDLSTMDILDKDRFRKDMGGLIEAYQDVFNRMERGSA
jgi:phosphoribosylaminoimidazole-succinocarboxamide synthase